MNDANTEKTKSNALFFTTHNSYADNINKIRYNQNVGINNSMSKNLRPINKMNILPYKPEEKKLNSEINFKVVGIILLMIFFLALIAFIIAFTTDKKSQVQEYIITAFYLNENDLFINTEFNKIHKINCTKNYTSSELKQLQTNLIQVDIKINSSMTNLSTMFQGVGNLFYINLSNINSFFINDFSHTFENCSNLKAIDLTSFNSFNIKSMNSLFKRCHNLRNIIGLETIDTSSLDNIEEMFADCEDLSFVNLTSFNLDKIKNKNRTFDNNASLKYVILKNTNNLNSTLYELFNSVYFNENKPNITNITIQVNGHSKINSTWFKFINKEEDFNISCDVGKNEKCKICNNDTNNKINNMNCEQCNDGYYLPHGNILSKTKCLKCEDNCFNYIDYNTNKQSEFFSDNMESDKTDENKKE